jgi:hypothetical protein
MRHCVGCEMPIPFGAGSPVDFLGTSRRVIGSLKMARGFRLAHWLLRAMTKNKMPASNQFAMACFARSGDDNFARALENHDLLDFYALGTRHGARGISPEHTRLQPLFGLLNYALAKTLPTYQAESLRKVYYNRAKIFLPATRSRPARCTKSKHGTAWLF